MAKLHITATKRLINTQIDTTIDAFTLHIMAFVSDAKAADAQDLISSDEHNALTIGSDDKLMLETDELSTAQNYVATINNIWST